MAGCGYDVRVLPNGRVGSVEGRFCPDLHVEVDPVLSSLVALDRARAAFAPGSAASGVPVVQFEYESGFGDPSVLTIVPRAGQYALAWGVLVQTGAREYTRVYVDAASGQAIARQPLGRGPVR